MEVYTSEEDLQQQKQFSDFADDDETRAGIFSITSYGADYTVEGLVKKVRTDAFYVPKFQRSFVWSRKDASRFIESLLMGLPIPGIFVFKEPDTGKHMIIDGQQRLTSLRLFYDEVFGESKFRLIDVKEPWNKKTYSELSAEDQLRLDDQIIHTTIFRQDDPQDDASIYEVFERINTGGLKLSPQEIRSCVNHGPFTDLLREMNDIAAWREIYGPINRRMKDQELILRFLAFSYDAESYKRPFKTFLDSFLKKHRFLQSETREIFRGAFEESINAALLALGPKAFRPERALNTAVFDSALVAIWSVVQETPEADPETIARNYDALLRDSEYLAAYTRATADEEQVKRRIEIAKKYLA